MCIKIEIGLQHKWGREVLLNSGLKQDHQPIKCQVGSGGIRGPAAQSTLDSIRRALQGRQKNGDTNNIRPW
jgi:hypothetical protein